MHLFLAGNLSFDVDNKQAFEVPLKNVSNSSKGKNEITLQFHQADDAKVSLMEIRFYVPPGDVDGDAVEVITHQIENYPCIFPIHRISIKMS
jgi:structure-specific recognition protein 1